MTFSSPLHHVSPPPMTILHSPNNENIDPNQSKRLNFDFYKASAKEISTFSPDYSKRRFSRPSRSVSSANHRILFRDLNSNLPHKQPYFNLHSQSSSPSSSSSSYNSSEYDEMDSDSTGTAFSDTDEDDLFSKTPDLKPIAFTPFTFSCTSSMDSFFSSTSHVPIKHSPTHRMESLPTNALQSIMNNKPELNCYLSPGNKIASPNTGIVCRALAPVKARSSWDLSSIPPNHIHYPKVRRTLSMFQNPKDVLKTSSEKKSQSAAVTAIGGATECMPTEQLSVLSREGCPLKSFTVDQDAFRRIDRNTLCEILDGQHRDLYSRHIVVDCRFEYEYEGGHIAGAVNINTKERLQEVLIANAPVVSGERTLLVFHCEYSAHRGPRMAMHLRQLDRESNMNRYPLLHYPDIVILDGGYSHFFAAHSVRCFPQQYVAMNDNADACEREMDRFRHTMKTKKKGVGRSQTFTFGSTVASVDAFVVSPVAATRSRSALFNKQPTARLCLNSCSESEEEAAKVLAEKNENDDDSFEFEMATPTQPTFSRRRLAGFPKLSQCSLF